MEKREDLLQAEKVVMEVIVVINHGNNLLKDKNQI
jgi:hypothetical protein